MFGKNHYYCRTKYNIMKILLKYGILLIITILCFYGNAQNLDVDSVFVIEELPPLDPEFNHIQPPYRFSVHEIERQNNDTLPYMFVEEMPEFPGGIDSLKAFLAREIQYPSVAKNNGITGTVLASFPTAFVMPPPPWITAMYFVQTLSGEGAATGWAQP